ncbi:hypothetical protein [Lactobacillus sp. UBA5813]|nr:hypothetical protein [Lactobacillus sp. UBA5813]
MSGYQGAFLVAVGFCIIGFIVAFFMKSKTEFQPITKATEKGDIK